MAEEIGILIGAKISEYMVEPLIIRPLRPIFCFKSIVDDFRGAQTRLSDIQETVRNEVQLARNNAQVIRDSVAKWLADVDAAMPDVQRLENQLEENRSSWSPKWTRHRRFSKQVFKSTAAMKRLCEEGNSFSSVSHPPALHQDIIGSSSAAGFMHSQSSKSAFEQIMEALERDDVNLIGLYGKTGTGKTTLAEQVGEEAKHLFNRVIMVPVSQHPQIRSIQGFIAGFLNLSLEQLETDQGRAAKLQLRLKSGEKILIILDDVLEEFNLSTVIGVPLPDGGCKVLLTARAEIHIPNTQRGIQLGALSEDEAWTMFKSITGVGDEVRMHGVAKDALVECNGLPKAVVAMGTVLKGHSVSDWEETLQQFNKVNFKILDSLKENAEKLGLRQDRVNTKIKMAKKNVEEIYPDVEKWLKDVDKFMNDVEQVENEVNQNRWCFDERDLATKVEALLTSVKDLYTEGNFDQVSHHTPPVQDMALLSPGDFMFSEAGNSAFSQIMGALETDGVDMIGLYGMGGIGKTKLANQVRSEVVRNNIFDHALMVTVSQEPDVGNMQDMIAEVLGLKLEGKSTDIRSSKLNQRLKKEKILIMLDDVWKWFDLRTIGVTLDDCKGLKILMTTRRRDVCSSMNCKLEVQLNLFPQDESQNFFKKSAGLCHGPRT